MAASVQDTLDSINAACSRRGGKYAQYSCQAVSWDDADRGVEGGALSSWGANITDTYLRSKDGRKLFTVRSDNWNEKLGVVSASDVALVAGEGGPEGPLQPRTLRSVLQELGRYGGYAGLGPGADLSDEPLDAQCSIRFQTTFLPVEGERGVLEFATEAYNYNTYSDADPRNLILLCTTQGLAVQQDGEGAKRLFHHAVDKDGVIHRYWLEAERSSHQVGGQQLETDEERADALQRGKAIASVIGTRAMGQRFNVLMTVQVPLQQQPLNYECGHEPVDWEEYYAQMHIQENRSVLQRLAHWARQMFPSRGSNLRLRRSAGPAAAEEAFVPSFQLADECDYEVEAAGGTSSSGSAAPPPPSAPPLEQPVPVVGTANAARVSRGSKEDSWAGLSVAEPERCRTEHVTITVVMYNTVAGGVPSEADVVAAIDDLESLYEACAVSGRLADREFNFMKKDLTLDDKFAIESKIANQPYIPPPSMVHNLDVFPTDDSRGAGGVPQPCPERMGQVASAARPSA